MFFNKDKKATALNNETKRRVLDTLETLISKSAKMQNSELSSALINIRDEVNTHAPASSEDLLIIDYKILRYLGDLQTDLDNNWSGTANLRINCVKKQLSARKTASFTSSKGFNTSASTKIDKIINKKFKEFDKKYAGKTPEKNIDIDELYSGDELLSVAINREQDKINNFSAEIEKLREKRLDNPSNLALKAELLKVQDNKKMAEECLSMYAAVRDKNSVAEFMKTVSAAHKEAMAMSGITDDELQVMYQEYQNEMSKDKASGKTIGTIRGNIMGSNSHISEGYASGQNVKSLHEHNYARVASGSPLDDPANHKYTEDELYELKFKAQAALKVCEKQGENYQEKFDEENGKYGILFNQLRAKMNKYDELNEAVKDGDMAESNRFRQVKGNIKREGKELETIQRAINAYDQKLDTNSKYKAIYKDALRVIDMQLDDLAMADIAGDIFTNIDSVALWLNATVKESNAQAEHIEDDYVVARGTDYKSDELSLDFDDVFKTETDDKDIAKIKKILGME